MVDKKKSIRSRLWFLFRGLLCPREKELKSLNTLIQMVAGHLNLVSKNQLQLMKRVQSLEQTMVSIVKKCETDSKVVDVFVNHFNEIKKTFEVTDSSIINLDSALRRLNSKVDFFAKDKE